MDYSEAGLALTKECEGCKLVAYLDGGGVPTIGYGHTHGVKIGDTCTLEQADAWLRQDVAFAVKGVNGLIKVPLTQGQFDALVDFAFNVGVYALSRSTLLKLLNSGKYAEACAQFARWNKDNGKVVAGLTKRRAAEAALFSALQPPA